ALSCASVPNAQPPLQQGSGSFAELHHQSDRLCEQRIVLGFPLGSALAAPNATFSVTLILWSFKELLLILGCSLCLPELNHGGNLFFRDKWSVQAMHTRRARRQIQHVALAQQRFSSVGVKDGPRVN